MTHQPLESPWDVASWLSKTTYTFVTPLLALSKTKELDADDLPAIPQRDAVECIATRLEAAWEQKRDAPNHRLLRALSPPARETTAIFPRRACG